MKHNRTVQSPNGVEKLMHEIWLRHKTGLQHTHGNMFMVELPPLTEEEKTGNREQTNTDIPKYSQKDLTETYKNK